MSNAKTEIKKLLASGVLGFYNCIETIEIFAIDPKRRIFNIYTLMIAESHDNPVYEENGSLIGRIFSITGMRDWKFGIKKYNFQIDTILQHTERLTEYMTWNESITNSKNLTFRDKKFVAPDSYEEVPINNILKNNFHNGSYIFEWFDESKDYLLDFFSKHESLKELSSKIQGIIPIAISAIPDRLGSFILQIPSKILQSKFTLSDKKYNYKLKCNIVWHPKSTKRDLILNCMLQEDDKLIEGYHTQLLKKNDQEFMFPLLPNKPHMGTVWDVENNLILAMTRYSAFIHPNSKITTSLSHFAERESAINEASNKMIAINIPDSIEKLSINNKTNWEKQRIYEKDSERLKESREFKQYNPKTSMKTESHSEAIKDIIFLINRHGKYGVWLWDPYLCPQDVFSTIFQNQHITSNMRAITSFKTPSQSKPNLCQMCFDKLCSNCMPEVKEAITTKKKMDIYRNSFETLNERQLKGINFEFRGRVGNAGWKFHDRFLIFPNNNNHQKPIAWSLGASVNGLGQQHHILQKVTDAQLISEAFIELWDNLSDKKCLIWSNHA